jgi:hypothetical protein
MVKKVDLTQKDLPRVSKKWPWQNGSLEEVNIANLLQFLKPKARIRFMNELHRVLKKGGKAQIVTPYWASSRAYGDLAFEYPPIAEPWYYHLNKEWRKQNAPWGTDYKCNFSATWGYGLHPLMVNRNQEYQQHAVTFWKESAQDMVATLIKL